MSREILFDPEGAQREELILILSQKNMCVCRINVMRRCVSKLDTAC